MLCKNVRVNTERFSPQSIAIGRRIRAARERHEWTMTELAKRAGVNHSYVSKAEAGLFGTPSVEKLSAIATALGLKLADLTGDPRPYSLRTIRHARTVLGMALGELVPDVLAANPVRRTRLPKRQRPEMPVWDADEAARFLAAADQHAPHLAPAYRLILHRALRRGEVLALRWADLDERAGVLAVDETAGRRSGETGDTKGRRRREIPLSPDLIDALAAHRRAQRRPSPWVFANPATGKPFSREALREAVARAITAAGLPPITVKDLRATAATVLLDQGVPLPRVSELLGHADVATTARFYARVIRLTADRVADVAEGMDAAFARAAGSEKPAELRPSGTENGTES